MKIKKLIILLIVITLLIGGGIAVWKWKLKETKNSDNSPTKTPLNQLSDKELEKCLLEDFSRRLDLEKFFIFGLGELQTKLPMAGKANVNWRMTNNRLGNDLTKLAAECRKHLEKQGYKDKQGWLADKNSIYFFGDDHGDILSTDNDFVRDLDQRITNGNWYIIFEKEKNYDWPLGWFTIETDSNGQKWLYQTNVFQLRIHNVTAAICESKTEALKFLKNNEPALQVKI